MNQKIRLSASAHEVDSILDLDVAQLTSIHRKKLRNYLAGCQSSQEHSKEVGQRIQRVREALGMPMVPPQLKSFVDILEAIDAKDELKREDWEHYMQTSDLRRSQDVLLDVMIGAFLREVMEERFQVSPDPEATNRYQASTWEDCSPRQGDGGSIRMDSDDKNVIIHYPSSHWVFFGGEENHKDLQSLLRQLADGEEGIEVNFIEGNDFDLVISVDLFNQILTKNNRRIHESLSEIRDRGGDSLELPRETPFTDIRGAINTYLESTKSSRDLYQANSRKATEHLEGMMRLSNGTLAVICGINVLWGKDTPDEVMITRIPKNALVIDQDERELPLMPLLKTLVKMYPFLLGIEESDESYSLTIKNIFFGLKEVFAG